MLLKRFYDDKLAQASYLVGSTKTGEALVVDPMRDPAPYIEAAKAEGVRITHVTETHIHADFVSGALELARRTGATLYLSDAGPAEWRYAFFETANAVPLRDGDTFDVGEIRVAVMHTPGHTPEHLTFLVTDTDTSELPMGAFTGDFVFVGTVGRPDLLERAAGVEGTMAALARELHVSLQRFRELPDWLQLWPGHGAGSACGKALGAVPQTTLGYEKMVNPGFTIPSEAEFVDWVLSGQPEPPKYFAVMKRVNKQGPAILGGFRAPARMEADRLPALLASGATVLDVRGTLHYGDRHIPGTLNIPLSKSFNTYAGALLPYDAPVYLLVGAGRPQGVLEAVRDLAMVGIDDVAGWFGVDALEFWRDSGRALGRIRAVETGEAAEQLSSGATVVDVRGRAEYEEGHIPGAVNIPLPTLAARAGELPADAPLVLHCESGTRSSIAASLLHTLGRGPVMNYRGGFADWKRAGKPIERGTADAHAAARER